jgi:hypothetical protein
MAIKERRSCRSQSTELTIQDWTGSSPGTIDLQNHRDPISGPVRLGAPRTRTNIYGETTGIRPGFIKRADGLLS